MKALILMLLPALMLIGCGQMDSNSGAASDVVNNMANAGAVPQDDANNISDALANEQVELIEMGGPNSIMMKVGGTELLIDFIENLSGDPEETAMIINGIEVAAGLLENPQNFQALIASIVTSQLEGLDIMGLPVADLIQAGLGLITGDTDKADFSNLLGTLVKGALNMFLSGTPYGSVFGAILDGIVSGNQPDGNAIIDGLIGGGDGDNQSGGLLGGLFGGNSNNQSSSPLAGILSLITNLITK